MTRLRVVKGPPKTGALTPAATIESGRAKALDLLVKGYPLQDILLALVSSVESAIEHAVCSVMLLDQARKTLSPLIAPGLPDAYLAAIHDLSIGKGVGSCGEAAYTGKVVVCDDMSTHPNCQELQELVALSGMQACWSQPIVSPEGEIYGTFAVYFPQPTTPTTEHLNTLEYEASLAALIIERFRTQEQLKRSNDELEARVEERTKALTQANVLLKKALEQRNEVQNQLLELENMASLGTMMSSLTHEINTPVGVAITAISHLRTLQQRCYEKFSQGQLKKSDLVRYYQECEESCDIIERNLQRSTQLIKTFKQLSLDQHSEDIRSINLCGYIDEILLSLKPRLKRTRLQFCIDVDPDLTMLSHPGAISQVLINLIMNSAQHGFEKNAPGRITLQANLSTQADNEHLIVQYRDNGKGMSRHAIDNLYKPFFTQARDKGGSGMGMHICYNLVTKVLEGEIDCTSTPGKGVHFTLRIPVKSAQ
ncbi:GAF domain-containing sensor histidine kinase [Aestuariibacter halophilus]|uniref:histidine kinase n=1 Tax=Fluctibacter halophilus TaxID=226011 RepID=A0ABS8GFS8_9ALTE|nr:GAF domain-containing sensor histidine kinase [Aestuariibacter halophilus]MCC2618046.1 GAF domain-containing sensor histidine kinase [Aestuariibacter halophilus]